ncbi:MAG: HAD family phosphatase [Treponema sp.]|jgi:putative hydrolase of the HAD superfamily|nr:HAD family phosphatase [Treponema sp.]
MRIKAVVFDFGKVICFPPPEENRRALLALTGLSGEALAELDRKHRGEYDRGAFDCKGYYRNLLENGGIFLDDPVLEKIAETDAAGWKRIDPGAVALMRDVKKLGFTLGILSNMPYDFLAWARKNIPVFGETDAAVFSCEVNSIKPERLIYEKLRESLGCEFSEIVFFDDIPDNVEQAGKLGIHGILWNGSEAAREDLEKIDRRFRFVPD